MQRKEPFPGKIFTPCVPERRFAGLFGCIARISCHSQLILNTRRQYAATNWRFSRPRPLLGCMERKTCHGLPPGNAFREHFANGAASSCGRVYCLAIALVPHESDDLFVQAVLCTRERGATSCAWRRHIVAMAGNRTEGRGALSRTWRGALNAGIRAEGADDKLAYALRQTGLHPSRRPTWAPPRIDRNIDVRRGTNPRVKRTSSACARLI